MRTELPNKEAGNVCVEVGKRKRKNEKGKRISTDAWDFQSEVGPWKQLHDTLKKNHSIIISPFCRCSHQNWKSTLTCFFLLAAGS